jgi:predicted permease
MLRRFLRWRSRRDPRIDDELRFHRDRLIDDYVAAGMARGDAERRAFLEFGNTVAIREQVRDVRGRWLDDFANDLTYALRTLRRSPTFALVAVLSLTLGIGANAAIFAVVNAVMLRSLPVKEPDRLIQITRTRSDGGPAQVSYPIFESFRDHIESISDAFVQMSRTQTMDIGDEEVRADIVSGRYFTVLGLEPAAGRLLVPADDVLSPAAPAAVISDGYWQRRFGRDPSAIGTTLTIRKRVFTIVGVTPPRFRGTIAGSPPDVILPLLPMMTDVQRTEVGFNFLAMLARLKPGATVEHALAEANVLYRPILEAQAAEEPSRSDREALLRQRLIAFHAPDGFNPIRDNIREPLLMLMGIVALILLLASMNVTGLLLARAAARQREISIRLAIGAGRGRLVRQFLAESLVLAAMGGVIGFVVAGRIGERLFALFVNGRTVDLQVRPDWRVVAFTAAISLGACVAAGLVPALQAFRARVNPALKEVRARPHGRLGKALVAAQLAISMVLVVGAALFIGTLVNLYSVDRGFDSDGLLVVQVRGTQQVSTDRGRSIHSVLLQRLNALPGVRSASAGAILPVGGGLWDQSVRVEGHASQSGEPERVAFNIIAPRYFATLGTPLLAGRDFSDLDTASSLPVAIVNERFARTLFDGRAAIGHHVIANGVRLEIIGVVADAKYQSLRESTLTTLYIPWTQRHDNPPTYGYLLRVDDGDPLRVRSAVAQTFRELNPVERIARMSTFAAWIDETIPTERLMATLGGLFASLALVLAGVGMFGVLAFQVAKRTNELGVRTVLGASRWSMMRLVLRDVIMMVAPGVVVGGTIALMLGRLARGLLFGLTPTEPGVFAIAALTLVSAALVAGSVPAHRASRVDPLVALRHE